MNYIYLDLIFVIGLLAESFILLGNETLKVKFRIMSTCIIGSLLYAMIVFLDGKYYEYAKSCFIFLFSILLAYIARDVIMPKIDKIILLIWNFFIYIYLQELQSPNLTLFIILLFSIVIIVNAFSNFILNIFWKTILYIWYLILLVYISLSQFVFSRLGFIIEPNAYNNLSGLESFITGMAFLYITVNIWYIIRFMPFFSEGKNSKEQNKMWKKEVTILMATKYSEVRTEFIEPLIVLVVFAGIYFINFQYNVIPVWFLMTLVIILTSYSSVKSKNISQ